MNLTPGVFNSVRSRRDGKGQSVIVGTPREIKADEYRVGMLPVGAHLLVGDGHPILADARARLEQLVQGFPEAA